MADQIPPLRSRTMTLDELQRATLLLIRRVRKQLFKASWESGLTDEEFVDNVLFPLRDTILQDIQVLTMAREVANGEHWENGPLEAPKEAE